MTEAYFGAHFSFLFSIFSLVQFTHTANINITDVKLSSCNQAECLSCDLEAARCVKCLYVIVQDTRQCLRNCPLGFEPVWSTTSDFLFGRMCVERSVLSLVSQRQVGIIGGASVLGAICVGIFLGFLVLHKKRAKPPPGSPPRALPRSLQDRRPKTEEINVKGKEKEEFISRLRQLRCDAPKIFRMMAETRNRFKGNAAGPDNPSETRTKACKAIVRDLSRVLGLLSRKEEHLTKAPKDWDRLLAWTERLLVRYKRQQELKKLQDKDPSGDGSPSPTGEGRHLFITRQQKAQEERRRWIERAPSNEHKTSESPRDLQHDFEFTTEIFGFPLKNEEIEYESPEDEEQEESIPDSPPPKLTLTPLNSTESLLPKPSPPICQKRKKKKDLMNLNRQLWSKLITFKDSSSNSSDVEKGEEDKCEDLQISLTNDEIPSQTFFDHIEAFAFEMRHEDKFEAINESSKDRSNIRRKLGKDQLKNIDNTWTEPFKKKINIKEMNAINLNLPPKRRYAKNNTENRPSRIRRISSSLLRKDKRRLIIPKDEPCRSSTKKRRPITRQKQVEKNKKSAILEKLKKHSLDASFAPEEIINKKQQQSQSTGVNRDDVYHQKTSTVNQVIEGDDVYIRVTKTPVLVHQNKKFLQKIPMNDKPEDKTPSFTFVPLRNSSTSSEESSSSNTPLTSSVSTSTPFVFAKNQKSNKYHRRYSTPEGKYYRNAVPRCEILTNV